ncbi:MAG TPA: KamA family radical SAM protein [Spirochaetaceae bacterium]|nr:KamA family radical SAM protein [Spirochaetaceae bacterium]HAX36800.1 KamA family radical SAM protein [Spirochaetaceae bacterium]HBO42045.1 KamA family radical SAM protein [Spirochaetaceae bacterium]HCQ86590.1 KamA family radical SAM protein [Spirochaetaceae bacterium]
MPKSSPWPLASHAIIRSSAELAGTAFDALEFRQRADLPGAADLPFAVSRPLLYRAQPDPADPLVRQFFPTAAERQTWPAESPDPLSERLHGIMPRLIHQYPNRVLIRVNGECAAYCRFCYRRGLLHERRGWLSPTEASDIGRYLAARRGAIKEVLLSGGDPLFASDHRLAELLQLLRRSLPEAVLRLCTRLPVALPERITASLTALLQAAAPLVLVLHCNHPSELSADVKAGLTRLRLAGVPLVGQSVLLRGVNDRAETLEQLCNDLLACGVQPYYLFQGDLAAGTAHFRVALSRGLALYAELRRRLSGLALPRYAVDAPDGKGKMYLPEDIVGLDETGWHLRNAFGAEARYPEEVEAAGWPDA